MSYPRNLFKLDGPGLAKLGLFRDSRGRIHDKAGAYVCGISGRAHSGRGRDSVRPVPDYDETADEWRRIWVDDQEFRAAGLEAGAGFLPLLGELALKLVTK